nr:galactosylceramide sulfotransferase-like [Lytechinus pictus]
MDNQGVEVEYDRDNPDKEDVGGDEESNQPSDEGDEKGEAAGDTLPRPDTVLDDGPKEEKVEDRRRTESKGKLTFKGVAPDGDPIARFHWNRKNPGAEQVVPPVGLAPGKCTPKTNITFLKVHKTGSSTVQNIFLRYGDQHSLSFVLPVQGHHLGYPNFFEKKHMLKVKNDVYNIYCHHSRFSNDVREVMPPNSVFISILRDPVKVFESAFTYFKLDMRMKMSGNKDAMKLFMDNPNKFYNDFPNKIHSRNGMLYDFGVQLSQFDDLTFISRAISMINDQFHLIMIAEYFDESLILLKELLCWKMEDVIVFSQNARNVDSVQSVDIDMRTKIQSWNSGDMLLYNYFNKTLWEKIERYGHERMKRDKAELERKTKSLFDHCISTSTAPREKGDFKVWQPPGVNINAFVLRPEAKGNKLCEIMIKPEIQYTMELKVKQFPEMNFNTRVKNKRVPSNMMGGFKRS